MSTAETPVYEWRDLPWRKLEQQVYRLQRRIFKASSRGDTKTVHRLQRLLMRSWAARCLAVRRVTQDNRGKKTAGIDGVASLTPSQRLVLANRLTPDAKAQPVRRVWIPKPGKTEKRPLGIPTMRDRAAQTLVRLALEPEWEAVFEPNSYGFRPGRSVHDAIEAVHQAACFKPKYVLDADIAACFDRIDHAALLRKLRTFPALRRVIHGWLKAGVWDGVEFKPTQAGTPQGGALSPLLANIALHGLESHLRAAFPLEFKLRGKRYREWKPTVVRYADDFVVLHPDRGVIDQVRAMTAEWLGRIGLELKPEKTRVCHTLEAEDGLPAGFDFLGHAIRQYPVSYHRSGEDGHGRRMGFRALTRPSKKAQAEHLKDLRDITRRNRGAPQARLVQELNLSITGWSNFFSRAASKKVFSRMDDQLYRKLRRWARRRHPQKNAHWVMRRYWFSDGVRHWNFGQPDVVQLRKHNRTPVERHVKVQGGASPYDGNLLYWARRLREHPEVPRRISKLLAMQRGKCARCGLLFRSGDRLEVDHIIPTSQGGKDGYVNWQLLHGHCHDEKTAGDRSLGGR